MTGASEQAAICPSTDIALYSLYLSAGLGLDTKVTFDATRPAPSLEILDSTGSVIATGTVSGDLVEATWSSSSTGSYFVKVHGSAEVNYQVRTDETL